MDFQLLNVRTETPYDRHYDEKNSYNKKGYREITKNNL